MSILSKTMPIVPTRLSAALGTAMDSRSFSASVRMRRYRNPSLTAVVPLRYHCRPTAVYISAYTTVATAAPRTPMSNP